MNWPVRRLPCCPRVSFLFYNIVDVVSISGKGSLRGLGFIGVSVLGGFAKSEGVNGSFADGLGMCNTQGL